MSIFSSKQALAAILLLALCSCSYLADAALMRADRALAEGDYEAAVGHAERASRYNDEPSEGQERRMLIVHGSASEALGDCDVARQDYQAILQKYPDSDEAYIARGKIAQNACP